MSAVIVSLRVKATPAAAFDVFTREIAAWWRPSPLFAITPRGDGVLRFENEEKLVAAVGDKTFEVGRVSVWRPGERLAFSWRQASFGPEQRTWVEVTFEPHGEETRVTVTHRGWDEIPQDHAARHGFPLAATQMRLAEHWRTQLAAIAARCG